MSTPESSAQEPASQDSSSRDSLILNEQPQSPMHQWHLDAGAKMAEFGGWQMPIEYPRIEDPGLFATDVSLPVLGGVITEHESVRNRVGLFDVSHLGKIAIKGNDKNSPSVKEYLNEIFTNDLNKVGDGQAQYTLLCNEIGGVVDDLIVYQLNENEFFLIPNASNTSSVFCTLKSRLDSGNYSELMVSNQHRDYAIFAIQGPLSIAALEIIADNAQSDERFTEVFGEQWLAKIKSLEYMSFTCNSLSHHSHLAQSGVPTHSYVCRTGYTGELGFEFVLPFEFAPAIWRILAGVVVSLDGSIAGLGARDTLRTEMGYPLHGHEITEEISPLRGGATWAVGFNKEKFIARDALISQKQLGVADRIRGLVLLERGVPRSSMKVFDAQENQIGEVTSGTYSPTRKEGIALALVNTQYKVGEEVFIDVRGRKIRAIISALPLVPSHVQ